MADQHFLQQTSRPDFPWQVYVRREVGGKVFGWTEMLTAKPSLDDVKRLASLGSAAIDKRLTQ